MPRKLMELPPEVEHRFVEDMRAYFAEKNWIKADEIAARQMHALRAHQRPHQKKIQLADVKDMFKQMRDHIRLQPPK